MNPMELKTPGTLVVGGLQELARRKDVVRDTHGNLSMRVGDFVIIKPSGMDYDLIGASDLVWVDIKTGEISSNPNLRKPSVDLPHHLDIYRRYGWVGSICHTHSPYATAFAYRGHNIECSGTEQADYFGHTIVCLPYADLDTWGKNVVIRPWERAVLLERHGTLTFGETPIEAVKLAIALENVAQKVFLSRSLTPSLTELPDTEITKWHTRYRRAYGQ